MKKYNCDTCNYETCRLNDMTRHNMSKKHIEKVKQKTQNNADIPEVSQTHPKNIPQVHLDPPQTPPNKEHKCTICGQLFTQACNLYRHRKKCAEKSIIPIEGTMNETEKLRLEVEKLKLEMEKAKSEYKLRDQAREIEFLKEQIKDKNSFKTIAETNSKTAETSISSLNFVIQNYNNAPAIEPFTKFEVLLENDKHLTVADVALHYYKKKEITKFIGDKIVAEHKKDDPYLQSIWNSDAARMAYLVREMINDEATWMPDKGGLKMSKYIIRPMLNHIKVDLKRYIRENRKKLEQGLDKTGSILNDMIAAQTFVNEIENGTQEKDIIKFLCVYLCLDKKKLNQKLTIEEVNDDENVETNDEVKLLT